MTWTRQLALVLGGSTYAFTATLFVVLIGIALGSLLFHAQRGLASRPVVPIAVVGVLIAATLVGKLALPSLSLAVSPEGVRDARGSQLGNALVCSGVSAALELLPSIAMGILFPLFVHLTHASAARVGGGVGNVYAFNTLGSIAGASLTSVLLFPWIGTTGRWPWPPVCTSWRCCWSCRGKAGADRARSDDGGGRRGAVVLIAQPIDPRLTNLGFYLYGHPMVGKEPGENWLTGIAPLFFREGASCDVLVARGEHQRVAPCQRQGGRQQRLGHDDATGAGPLSAAFQARREGSDGDRLRQRLHLGSQPLLSRHARDMLRNRTGRLCRDG